MNYSIDILRNSWKTDARHRESTIGSQSMSQQEQTGCKSFFRFPKRFFFVLVFFASNLGYAAFTVYTKWEDSRTTISHVLLVILTFNLMNYLFYYTMRTWYASFTRKKWPESQWKQHEGILLNNYLIT